MPSLKMKTVFKIAVLFAPLIALPTFAKDPVKPVKQVVDRPWLLENEKNTIDVFEKAADNVVFVSTSANALVGNFFEQEVVEIQAGAGTGFVWDSSGYIVTNFHVIRNPRGGPVKSVTVTLRNGKKSSAKLVGVEPNKDIAVLKIQDVKDLPAGFSTQLADSSELLVGQKTIAIGNPFELSHTLTTGVVSALNRTFPSPLGETTIRDMIQTDAAINPGNSGGPLMDSRAYLIGMNTAIYSQSGNSAGVGFAVPSNTIKRVVTQLIKSGKVTQPSLGFDHIPESVLRRFRINVKGVIIKTLQPHGGAKKAGLLPTRTERNGEFSIGDLITAVDGKPVESVDDLYNILENKQVGDKVSVSYVRKGEKHTTTVQLNTMEY